MIKVKETTVAAADMNLLGSTPKDILAAPDTGYVNNILGVTAYRATDGGTAYDDGAAGVPTILIKTEKSPAIFSDGTIAGQTVISERPFARLGTFTPISTIKKLQAYVDGTIQNGTVDITFRVIYEVKLAE